MNIQDKLIKQDKLISKITTTFHEAIKIYREIGEKNPSQKKITNKKIKILQKKLKNELSEQFSTKDTLIKKRFSQQIKQMTKNHVRC